MGFPTTSVLDNFNRANEGPPPSASWVDSWSSGVKVVSNACEPDGTFFQSSTWNTSYDADQECFADLVSASLAASTFVCLWVRLQTASDHSSDHYEFNWYTDHVEVWKRNGGAWTQLGANISDAPNAGDQLGMDVSGSTITLYRNGTSVGTRSDSGVTGDGYIGCGFAYTTGNTPAFDDFGGGAIVAGGGTFTGIGGLTTQAASVAGVGAEVFEGQGNLTTQPATVAGVGQVVNAYDAAGTLTTQTATVAGVGAEVFEGQGNLTTQAATLAGVGNAQTPPSGAGSLVTHAAITAGVGIVVNAYEGLGDLVCEAATVAGVGLVAVGVTGAGALSTGPASVAGVGFFSEEGPSVPGNLVVPDVGKFACLHVLLAGLDTPIVRLFKNNITPGPGTVALTFVEADFPGYAAKPLVNGVVEATLDGYNRAVAHWDQVEFIHTGGPTGNQIYGYWVEDTHGLLWAERFSDAPRSIVAVNDFVAFVPRVTTKSQFLNE